MFKNLSSHLIQVFILFGLVGCTNAGWQSKMSATSTLPRSGSTQPAITPVLMMPTAQPTQTVESAPDKEAKNVFDLPRVSGTYQFTEGPAADAQGNVYFSDIDAGKIYRWSQDGSVTVFIEGLNMPNGLEFDANGNLIACEGGNGRLISIDAQKHIKVLADQYHGVRFNEPNDLWIDPQGGIYFTDPAFHSQVVQDGEDVYYLTPDGSQVIRVIADMVQPNGIAGTRDGKTLYVADYSAGQTFRYSIDSDGSLSNKTLFVPSGSDGMKLDAVGNVYLTAPNQIQVFSPAGLLLQQIPMQEGPTNLVFAGADSRILFITARTAVYTMQMAATTESASVPTQAVTPGGFTLTSPDVVEGGTLAAEYTCDGAASTLALAWSGAPAGTKSYAVIMHHIASPTDIHWYWVVYDIPAGVTSLPKNMQDVGILGNNSVNGKTAYTPPCSKGPGAKTYTYTVYALSAEPQLSEAPSQVNRQVLLDAIKDITLASAELHVTYTRP